MTCAMAALQHAERIWSITGHKHNQGDHSYSWSFRACPKPDSCWTYGNMKYVDRFIYLYNFIYTHTFNHYSSLLNLFQLKLSQRFTQRSQRFYKWPLKLEALAEAFDLVNAQIWHRGNPFPKKSVAYLCLFNCHLFSCVATCTNMY